MLAASATTVPVMKTMRRPMMSANEDQNKGPRARPRAGIATVQLTSSAVRLYCSCSCGNEGTVVVVTYVNMKYLQVLVLFADERRCRYSQCHDYCEQSVLLEA